MKAQEPLTNTTVVLVTLMLCTTILIILGHTKVIWAAVGIAFLILFINMLS